MKTPFVAMPSGADARAVTALSLAFMGIFLFFYGGASALSAYVPWRIHVDFGFEAAIPFVPAASLVYLSMDLLVGMAPFVLRDLRSLFPMFATLTAQTVIGAVCFMLLPVETNFPMRVVEGAHAAPFAAADLMNLERNFLPSLHVGFAVTAALAYGGRCSLLGKLVLGLWAAAIAASTMLIHEHHLMDVIAGAALAYWMSRTVGRWAAKDSVVADVDVEWICLRSYAEFGRRHVRYLLIALGLSRAGLPHWRRRRVLRTGFCFLQIVDDLLDGDRACDHEPLEVVEALVVALEDNRFGDDELSRLARAFRQDILEAGGPELLADALKLIRVMQVDRRRVLDATVLAADEMRAHHRLTFYYSVDMMLAAAGMEVRADDVPELIEAFGWCSTVRDLEEDLDAGLVNVPLEVVGAARAEGAGLDYGSLIQTPAVAAWMRSELLRAVDMLDRTDARLAKLEGRSGVAALAMFARSIRGYAERRLPKRFPDLALGVGQSRKGVKPS